jgi:hypothetical protein
MVYKNIGKNICDFKAVLLRCDGCDCTGIEFILDPEDNLVFVSVQPEGYNALHELSLKGRLIQAFKIIFKYKCYYDNLVVEKDTFNAFVDELNKLKEDINK